MYALRTATIIFICRSAQRSLPSNAGRSLSTFIIIIIITYSDCVLNLLFFYNYLFSFNRFFFFFAGAVIFFFSFCGGVFILFAVACDSFFLFFFFATEPGGQFDLFRELKLMVEIK